MIFQCSGGNARARQYFAQHGAASVLLTSIRRTLSCSPTCSCCLQARCALRADKPTLLHPSSLPPQPSGWNYGDRGQIEQKYTGRAAELYAQLLAKEVSTAIKTGQLPASAKSAVRPSPPPPFPPKPFYSFSASLL